MAPWKFHEQFAIVDVKGVPRYPNHYSPDWLGDLRRYDDNTSLVIPHIENFLRYISEINVTLEDVMMRLFVYSFEKEQCDWVKHCGGPKSITSIDFFFELFMKRWGPPCQDYKSALNNYLENKVDEVLETIEIQETLPFLIGEDLEY
jgi:hypothetical protein